MLAIKGVIAMAVAVVLGTVAAPVAGREAAIDARLTVHAGQPGPKIDRNIYGQFVEHLGRGVYEGIWVGEDSSIPNTRGIRKDVVAALRKLRVPVVRWPGGCFADSYDWREGIGPRSQRPKGINASWGNEPETNAFGTHEFMDFLEQIGAQPFISVNVGSGSPREAEQWLRYMTAPSDTGPGQQRARNGREQPWSVPYVGVGNESWGCGGNMFAERYADEFRQYAAYLRTYNGAPPQLIAVGADSDEYGWTETMMARAMKWRPDPSPLAYNVEKPLMGALSLHFYTFAGNDWYKKGRAIDFGEEGWVAGLARANHIDELITRHSAIMDKYDPEKQVALAVDEWGAWWDGEKDSPSALYRENTLRDAVIAGLTLNIFHRHADRVRMANIAQMVNVIQAMILTRGKDMILTPTYHVFDMYKVHQDATLLPVDVQAPAYAFGKTALPGLSVSASRDAAGKVHLSIVNLNPHKAAMVKADLEGMRPHSVSGQVLTAAALDARNSFEAPNALLPAAFKGAVLRDGVLTAEVPAKSVTVLEIK